MANARSAAVPSHRRAPRRRLAFLPWVVAAAVVIAGGAVAYRYTSGKPHTGACTGSAHATVVAAPATAALLDGLATSWARTAPAVGRTCASVTVETRDSAVMAQALGTDWDATKGPRPDVWVPDSTAWVDRASTAPVAERMMPDLQPSLARSPTVIAMPRPMAQALGWPTGDVSWADLINKLAADPAGWATYGKPEWGPFKFGMSDPLRSTSSLLSLMAVLDGDDDGEVTPAEQDTVYRLKQDRAVYTATTEQILQQLRTADAQGTAAALRYVSAFPAFEHDVLAYDQANPQVPLVAIYPSNGSADADNPYLILDSTWATPQRQQVAKAFEQYARGPAGKKAFLDAGFRDANRTAGSVLATNAAFTAKIKTLPRAVLLPESVTQSMDTWTALTRPTNVLLVLDVSGSMAEQVPGTGQTRMRLAKDAATSAVRLFADDVDAGLWMFATHLAGTTDYRSLVPLGKVADPVGRTTRRAALAAAIDKLTPAGNTGLYDTAAAAQQAVVDSFQPGATNLVVLMTDGKNDDDTGGLTLDQLTAKLDANAKTGTKVPIVTVGYGNDADFAALQQISRVSGGALYTSKTAFDINQVLLTAIFGRVG